MENNMELNLNEMEEVVGGKNEGGFLKKPAARTGRKIYRIVHGDIPQAARGITRAAFLQRRRK